MGKTLHQFARSRQNQQAAGVDVQPPNRHPAAAGRLRQAVENAHAPLRVVARHDFAFLLVIQDDARQAVGPFELDSAAFHGHLVFRRDFLAQHRHAAVHLHPAVVNPLFHFAARTDTAGRQHLLQAFRLNARQIGAFFFQFLHMLLDFLVRRAHHQFACLGGALLHGCGIFFLGLLVPCRAALPALGTVFLRLFRFAAFDKVQAVFGRFG